MFKRPRILFLLLLAAGAASAQVYKWVDENGVVHYSDQPVEGAEQVRVDTRAPASPPRPRPATPAEPESAPEEPAPAAPFSYESIGFSSPQPEQTLWNIGGVLNVSISLSPGLQSGHRVRLYFDGTPRMVNGTNIQLEEVWRGAHNLQVEVIDASGRLMIRSQPIRFYVQQSSVLN